MDGIKVISLEAGVSEHKRICNLELKKWQGFYMLGIIKGTRRRCGSEWTLWTGVQKGAGKWW